MSSKRSRAALEAPHAPYAVYGTPLPAYDPEVRDDGSYVPVWQQEVRDERGRKRLHGAFTGGWSAGYYNTVGSKEGWTPSTFVSTRANRAKDRPAEQRVEDFMDEEDLAERAESQRLETQSAFAGLGSGEGQGSSRGMFADLFRATGDTMGIKLLQRMGWRPGQGIGAKVRRRAQGDEKSGEAHLFAPENSPMILFRRKNDHRGLGFAGEESLKSYARGAAGKDDDDDEGSDQDARILQSTRSTLLSKPKKIKKSGFGVGVLNDTGSDDEDPYSVGPQIKYNRIIGADRRKKKGLSQKTSGAAKPILASKKLAQRATVLSGFRRCHDGRLPLDGFVLVAISSPPAAQNRYPPPEVPLGWTPKGVQKSNSSGNGYQSTADAAKASTLDPKSRAALLGEQQLPGKSVFDFMSPAARDRLVTASGKTNLPAARGEGAPVGFEGGEADKHRTLWDLVPPLDKQTAAAALERGMSGWMPYAEDVDKRRRYRYFLELRAGMASDLPERPRGFSAEEWGQELREFGQAAAVFKPISGLMASRFTSSATAPRLASDAPDESSINSPAKEEDPAEKAAKLSMFGPLTRSRQQFYPTRLLCKRFGVRPPAGVTVDPGSVPGDEDEGGSRNANSRLELVSKDDMEQMMREAGSRANNDGAFSENVGGDDSAMPWVSRSAPAEVDVDVNHALEGQRAGEAVFRAVFGSDDGHDD